MSKFTVTFSEGECKGCGLCVAACPKKIISLNLQRTNNSGYNPAFIDNMEECIGCRGCGTMCPDSVITIVKND